MQNCEENKKGDTIAMTSQDTYLQLLRGSLLAETNTAISIQPNQLSEILRLCRIHGTGPMIYNELLKGLEPELAVHTTAMKQVCMQNMMLQERWEQLIGKCFGVLSEGGVHAILMKGFAYARMYPLPYLRAWGDLDIWVGPEQYHRACALLRKAFPDAKHHDEEWDELKHYCFVFENGMAIEVHRVSMDFLSPKDQAYWCRLEAEASQSTYAASQLTNEQTTCSADNKKPNATSENLVINGVEIPLFETKFDILFCFMHSWEHFTGTGIPLKQVADMALLVQSAKCKVQNEELEAYLEKHLKALRMQEVWNYYGYMACKAMGMDMAEWPLLGKSMEGRGKKEVVKYGERLYEQVMAEGQCRKKDYGEAADRYEARENARQMNLLARKWLTLRQRVEKARHMHHFAPGYARYVLWQEIKKGVRRTIRGEEMINY